MTNIQFKEFLKDQMAWAEAIKEKLEDGDHEEAMKLLEALIQRTRDMMSGAKTLFPGTAKIPYITPLYLGTMRRHRPKI